MRQEGVDSIRWFRSIGNADRESVGGKGASLGELQRAGIPVPAGFVITTQAFRQAALRWDPDGEMARQIGMLDAQDLGRIAQVAKSARERVMSMELPDDLGSALAAACRELESGQTQPLAIRSSATGEDGDNASFAGLQDTILWVKGIDDVLEAVRKCWASLYTDESVSYRRRLAFPEQDVAMGVVVQLMVNARCAGVMFTRSPTTGDRSVIAIESSWGLGSALVSGEVTPDKVTLSKVTGAINKMVVSDKQVQHVPNPSGSGICTEPIPSELRNAPCLGDEELKALWQLAKRAEAHYGIPVDIEWAIDVDSTGGSDIQLLQCRPETVWSSKESKGVAPADTAMALILGTYTGQKQHS